MVVVELLAVAFSGSFARGGGAFGASRGAVGAGGGTFSGSFAGVGADSG